MRRTCFGVVGLLIALGQTGTAAAETVDNPAYQMWAGWREGTSVTTKSETVVDGKVLVSGTTTITLKQFTADKAVIEVSSVGEAGGQTIKTDPVSTDVPAKLPKEPAANPQEVPQPTDVPKVKQTKGRERLTVNGKALNCEWTQLEGEGGMVTKVWHCEDVPLGHVKTVSSHPGGSTTMQVLEWKGAKK